jgi:hypothetical protein
MKEINEFEDIPAELLKELEENGYCFLRVIPGKGICALSKLMFTVGIVYGLDMFGYEGRYCYHTWHEAIVAFIQWDGTGDPSGRWIVHKGKKGGDIHNPAMTKEVYGYEGEDSTN